MTTATWALGLGAFVGALYTFYTGTLNVIFTLAMTDYRAATYVLGMAIVIGVPLSGMFLRRRLLDVNGRNLALAMIICLLVMPYVIEGAYGSAPFTELGTERVDAADIVASISYMNTTGNWVSTGTITDADTAESIVTLNAATMTAQDTDKKASLAFAVIDIAREWNVTSFYADVPITCIGIRLDTGTDGVAFDTYFGWNGNPYEDLIVAKYGKIYSDSEDLTYIYLTATQTAAIEDVGDYLDGASTMQFVFIEWDANSLKNGVAPVFELHFYTSTGNDLFYEYLLYGGLINIMIGLAMTRYWNPTGKGFKRW